MVGAFAMELQSCNWPVEDALIRTSLNHCRPVGGVFVFVYNQKVFAYSLPTQFAKEPTIKKYSHLLGILNK